MARDRSSDTHRTVASQKLGRPLTKNEDVHHLDDNKTNNAPGNLEVKGHGDHSRHTQRTKGLRQLRRSLSMVERKEKLY